jgi:hypothetical protein
MGFVICGPLFFLTILLYCTIKPTVNVAGHHVKVPEESEQE